MPLHLFQDAADCHIDDNHIETLASCHSQRCSGVHTTYKVTNKAHQNTFHNKLMTLIIMIRVQNVYE